MLVSKLVNYSQFSNTPCFNHDGYFIIILDESKNVLDDHRDSSRSLQNLGIANAIFVIYGRTSSYLEFFSFQKALTTQDAVDHLFADKSAMFQGYRYQVLRRVLAPYFYVEQDQFEGFDKQLLDIISEYQSATVEYGEGGYIEDNISFAFGYSQRRTSFDLSLFRSRTGIKTILDRAYLPEWDHLCIIVPKRHRRMRFLRLIKPFETNLWILIVVLAAIRMIMRRYVNVKLLVLAYIFWKFVLAESYLAKIIQFLTDLKYFPDPETVAELIHRKEKFAIYPEEKGILEDYPEAVIHIIVNKTKTEFFEHSRQNFNTRTNDKLIIILKERLGPYASCYGFAKNHPIRKIFERYMRQVFESGIWRKIYDQYTTKEGRFLTFLRQNEYPIDFEDFETLWILLGIGVVISMICFLVEMCKKR